MNQSCRGIYLFTLKMGITAVLLGMTIACEKTTNPPATPPEKHEYDQREYDHNYDDNYNGQYPDDYRIDEPYNPNDLAQIPSLPYPPDSDEIGFDDFEDSDENPDIDFDPFGRLESQGIWITIGGERFFRPNVPDRNDWQPYQRGYWSYDLKLSWTWVSHDPWGDVTDHYGVWRHHGKHGWIWLPFADRRYRPHCVTWFDQGDYVGWYPYFPGYKRGYRHGYQDGFDDGYWDGYRAAQNLDRRSKNRFSIGITIVNRRDVTDLDIYVHARKNRLDNDIMIKVVRDAHREDRIRNRLVGPIPGGRADISYKFIRDHADMDPVMGTAKQRKTRDGQLFIEAPKAKKDRLKEQKKRKQGDELVFEKPETGMTTGQNEETPDASESQNSKKEKQKNKKAKKKKQIKAPEAPPADDLNENAMETQEAETRKERRKKFRDLQNQNNQSPDED